MQEKRFDGSWGKPEPLTPEGLKQALEKPTTEHVEVFEATEENLKYRNKLFKKRTNFKKTGSNKNK